MDIRWSPPAVAAFELFFRPWLRLRLSGVYFSGLPTDVPADRAVILAANHTSWWDPFLLREAHIRVRSPWPLVTLMEESQLDRFPYFRLMGVTGVGSAAAQIRRTMRALERRREKGPFWLTIFPQGRIGPSWKHPLGFRRGIDLFARVLRPAVIIPVGIHLEAGNHPGPAAFVSFGTPVDVEGQPSLSELEARVSEQIRYILSGVGRYGEGAPQAWPFPPLENADLPSILLPE